MKIINKSPVFMANCIRYFHSTKFYSEQLVFIHYENLVSRFSKNLVRLFNQSNTKIARFCPLLSNILKTYKRNILK